MESDRRKDKSYDRAIGLESRENSRALNNQNGR
jgi:hypothetical protein